MGKLGKRGSNPGGSLSTQQVATVLGISHPTLLKLLKGRKIPEPQKLQGVRYWNQTDVKHASVVLAELRAMGGLRGKGGRRA